MNELQWWAAGGGFAAGLVLCVAGTAVVRRLALWRNFVDTPGGHKRHQEAVALGGGIAITLAIVVPIVGSFAVLMLITGPGEVPRWIPDAWRQHIPGMLSKTAPALGLAGGAVVLHIMGLVDDRRHLGPWTKLIIQVLVAAGVVLGLRIRLLSSLGIVPSALATMLWIVLITNAFNFLDNMDGLCAGVAAIAAIFFGLCAMRVQQIFVPALAFLVAGAMLGYLWHNFPPAKIFMGDSGSLVIGYFLSILAILPTYWDSGLGTEPVGLLVPVVVLAVPLYDTTSVIVIRLVRGASPFRGDQRHFSHRLVQRGMRPTSAVLTIYLATAATGLSGLLLPGASWSQAGVVLGQCLCVVLIIAILEQVPSNAKP